MANSKQSIEEAAEKYAEHKSSSSVFKQAHIEDFTTGALSDVAKEFWFEQFKAQQKPVWVNGWKRQPDMDNNNDEPKKYIVRVYGDDPRSGCIYVGYETAEQMRSIEKEEDGYWEWLDESAMQPQLTEELKTIIKELEQYPDMISIYNSNLANGLVKNLSKLKAALQTK